ncbi:glycine cleavage system aminomethyltransferase GcvT [Acidiferrobacter sp.]|uniref:glycine cleavage system aminomethyltransferase GcvT n=1 Tax=Acidiferrobacter sp. TaxID=1872107 RepID=UPI00345B5C52
MGHRTPLYEEHVKAGARMVDFGGFDMPLHYGSQIAEHHAVRRHAGIFDVSHMRAVEVQGADARPYLRYLLANDVDKLGVPGKALYGCLLNEDGGVLDDLIVYYLAPDWFRLVVNAGPAEGDIAWLRAHTGRFAVAITPRPDLAMVAVQGPHAEQAAAQALAGGEYEALMRLAPFQGAFAGDTFVARTGYTGEAGFEVLIDAREVAALWRRFVAQGVVPAGLGARDTLRLEAGMNLYGHDMDATVSPLESGLAWTVSLGDREFIGRAALVRERERGVARRLTGVVLRGPGVVRSGQGLRGAWGPGVVTSGSFSPTLSRGIGLVRVPGAAADGDVCELAGRPGQVLEARLVAPPFVRQGRALIDLEGEGR